MPYVSGQTPRALCPSVVLPLHRHSVRLTESQPWAFGMPCITKILWEARWESWAGQRPSVGLSQLSMSLPCVLQCSWGPGMPTRS